MVTDRPVVKTIGLTKRFKDFWRRDRVVAVDRLDLEIRQGEVFGLLGPNGSGKSTTIKMLLGLLYPTRGRISIFDRPPTNVAIKSRIGYLPEESYLYRFLNAKETLQLYAKLFQQAGAMRRSRIDKLLEMVGLQHQAKRRIGEYSKGMARRIGLAQALINDPDFLILDEPTTGMDPIGTQQVKQLIRELAGRGKTILLSSHLLSDVQDVCDRVCILYGGQEQATGRVDDLLRQVQSTQITSPALKPETVEEIKLLIAQREERAEVEVSHPTERLETFFVRIVQQAQAAQVSTSGVEAGGQLADFLAEPQAEQEALIGELVAAADQPSAHHVEEVVPVEPSPADAVVEELLGQAPPSPEPVTAEPAAEAAQAPTPAAKQPQPVEKDKVDRSVIDSLLGASEEDKSG
jgi:ABC-2 type transport system ATP-binding protein